MAELIQRVAGSGEIAIDVRDLTMTYDRRAALTSVTLQVPRGAVYVIAGANGAGKSSLFRALVGLSRPASGSATVLGFDTVREAASVRASVGYSPDHGHWGFDWMSVRQLLSYYERHFGTWDRGYADELCRVFQLPLSQHLRALSTGQMRRVALTTCLAHRPPVMILDEPLEGLDPLASDLAIRLLIDHLADVGCTLLISTHHVEQLERLADWIAVLRRGEVIAQLPTDLLRARLRRYRAVVGPEWKPSSVRAGVIMSHKLKAGRDLDMLALGDDQDILAELMPPSASGAESQALTLGDAVRAILTHSESEER